MSSIGKLIVLSGPGGVGKSTIVNALKNLEHFYFSVSATTRSPRPGEENGVAYHFVDNDQFEKMINDGTFLEWANFAGAKYGTPRLPVEEALNSGKNVLLEIEIDGARQIKKAMPNAIMVFLQPPSMTELEARITNRGTDSPERIAARLALARAEMAAAEEFDHLITNHQVEEVIQALVSLAAS